jgi:hypothetical protein
MAQAIVKPTRNFDAWIKDELYTVDTEAHQIGEHIAADWLEVVAWVGDHDAEIDQVATDVETVDPAVSKEANDAKKLADKAAKAEKASTP